MRVRACACVEALQVCSETIALHDVTDTSAVRACDVMPYELKMVAINQQAEGPSEMRIGQRGLEVQNCVKVELRQGVGI